MGYRPNPHWLILLAYNPSPVNLLQHRDFSTAAMMLPHPPKLQHERNRQQWIIAAEYRQDLRDQKD